MSEWPRTKNRSGDLFDAGMTAYSRLWLMRTGVTDLVAAVIDAVEPLIRENERGRFHVTEYPDGRVKTLIVDGTHWVTVSAANMQEGIGVAKAVDRYRADLRAKVEALDWWIDDQLGADPITTAVVYRDDVLALFNGEGV